MSRYDPRFYVRPVAFGRRWQNDYYPDHPDVGKLAAEERRRTDALADWDGEEADMTDYFAADYLAALDYWRRVQSEQPHRHGGCRHECDSLACYTIAGLKDSRCVACQLGEPDGQGPSRGMNERKP